MKAVCDLKTLSVHDQYLILFMDEQFCILSKGYQYPNQNSQGLYSFFLFQKVDMLVYQFDQISIDLSCPSIWISQKFFSFLFIFWHLIFLNFRLKSRVCFLFCSTNLALLIFHFYWHNSLYYSNNHYFFRETRFLN